MNHLTHHQIQLLVDEAFEREEHADALKHVGECPLCERELAFHRAVLDAGRRIPFDKPSRGFTGRVMERVVPGARHSFTLRLLGMVGKGIAMAVVLGSIAYVLATKIPAGTDLPRSEWSTIDNSLSGYYAEMKQFVTRHEAQISSTVSQESTDRETKIVAMTVFSLLLLGVLDKFFLAPRKRFRS